MEVMVLLAVFGLLWLIIGDSVVGGLRGRLEADWEWSEGRATIFGYGLMRGAHQVDRETGLPFKSIAGCVVTERIMQRARWHNERIMALIARDGMPAYSWKVREPGVCEMEAMWKRRIIAGEKGIRLPVGGRVWLGGHLVVSAERRILIDGAERSLPCIGRPFEMMGGEKMADVLYVRWVREDGLVTYEAVDMKDRVWLRSERAPDETVSRLISARGG
jgi:hypothetical protein